MILGYEQNRGEWGERLKRELGETEAISQKQHEKYRLRVADADEELDFPETRPVF